MAIGKLLDYERHIEKPTPKNLQFFAKKPREDLIDLLESLEIMTIYPEKKYFVHIEKIRTKKTSMNFIALELFHQIRRWFVLNHS